MAWEGSNRRERLPAGWSATRIRILNRDGWRCTWIRDDDGAQCNQAATDVDHVTRGDDHRDDNLTSLCPDHHATKSGREGAAARHREPMKRPAERHPGLK